MNDERIDSDSDSETMILEEVTYTKEASDGVSEIMFDL
jgi:hypothetical protein